MSDVADAWHALGPVALITWIGALGICYALILGVRPIFGNLAVAIPNSRSSHTTPTPQWGGLAISAATLVVIAVAMVTGAIGDLHPLARVLIAAGVLVLLGATDDHSDLGAGAKLAVQAAAAALVVTALPQGLQPLPFLPAWLATILLFLGVLWFVNLVNFMDGIDWMMVAEIVPITAGVAVIAALAPLPSEALVVALALNGAMLGFAPFNRPVAKLFMGDAGSLPVGLLVAWLLLLIAGTGNIVAALLLPLYFLADTGITLLRRLIAGERVWQAHRTHFYQRARGNGLSALAVVGRVFAVNMALVALASASVVATSPVSKLLTLVAGAALVGWLMLGFSRGPR